MAGTIIAGCGGGSTPSPTVVPAPTASPGSSLTSQVAVPGTGGTIFLSTVGGFTPAFGILTGAPYGLAVNFTESTNAPGTAPAPSSSAIPAAPLSGVTALFYVSATFSAAVPANVIGYETLTLPSLPSVAVNYYSELDDLTPGAIGKVVTFGPALQSNGSVTITNATTAGPAPALAAGHTYLFQFYSLPVPTPSPSPSPSPTPTPSPAPSPTLSSPVTRST